MTTLITEPNLDAPDDFYAALLDAHHDIDSAQSHELNAKLLLLLANHIGSLGVLRQALAAARSSVVQERQATVNPDAQLRPSRLP